jgi:hypothetical protein
MGEYRIRNIVYAVALLAGLLGIAASFMYIPHITPVARYLVMGGFVLLALGYPKSES